MLKNASIIIQNLFFQTINCYKSEISIFIAHTVIWINKIMLLLRKSTILTNIIKGLSLFE